MTPRQPPPPVEIATPQPAYVVLHETEYWALPPALAPHVRAVYGVYATDLARRVHCCEMTASYALDPIDNLPDIAPNTSDAVREAIGDAMREALAGADMLYVHCASIDRLPRDPRPAALRSVVIPCEITDFADCSDPDEPPDTLDTTLMDAMRESWAANPLL